MPITRKRKPRVSQKPFVAPYPAQGGQPTPGSLRRVSSAPRPRSPPPVVANTIPACSVRPPSFDMGPNPYTERLVPIPIMEPVGRVTAPSWVRCAFIFDAVKDRYGEGVVIGTSMQDCLAGEGMQNGLDNLFRGSDFPHEDITMIIYWPGYEHFRYRCKIPLKADGQHITRRGLGYHIAVAYRNFFQNIGAHRLAQIHPGDEYWHISEYNGIAFGDLSLAFLVYTESYVWQAGIIARRKA